MISNDIIADSLIAGICPRGGAFLDVGAHIGSILAAVHHSDPAIRIFAVEADKRKADALSARFAYCDVRQYALGETTGEAKFFHRKSATGYNSLISNGADDGEVSIVQLETMDRLFPDQNFDVIKMDIEGAELGALRGGVELIRRSRPLIMFECVGTAENSLGYSAEKLWDWFAANDYIIFAPNRLAHNAPPLSRDAFLYANHYPFLSYNYFAVPPERREMFRDRARTILGVRGGK